MKRNIDFTFLVIVIMLVSIGTLMVFSSSFYYALNRFNNMTKFFDSNLVYGILGFIALYITSKINYRIYKKPSFAPFIFFSSRRTYNIIRFFKWVIVNSISFSSCRYNFLLRTIIISIIFLIFHILFAIFVVIPFFNRKKIIQ